MEKEVKIFNLTGEKLSPEDTAQVVGTAHECVAEYEKTTTEGLKGLSVEPWPEIRNLENELAGHFEERNRNFGMPEAPSWPKIFYIPTENVPRAKEIMSSREKTRASTNRLNGSVALYLYPGMTNLEIARILAHEMDHFFTHDSIRVEIREGSDQVVSMYREGGITLSPKGDFGRVLEEGSAENEAIRYFIETLAPKFPDEFAKYLRDRTEFIQRNGVPPTFDENLIFYYFNSRLGARSLLINPYAAPVLLIRMLEEELPDGRNLVLKARVRGNYVPLAKAFEGRFGQGTFRTFMELQADQPYKVSKFRAYLLENDPNEKEVLKSYL